MEMSVDALEELAKKGLIIRYKIGGLWRYNEKDLDEYFHQQHGQGSATAAQLRDNTPKPIKLRPNERRQPTIEEVRQVWR